MVSQTRLEEIQGLMKDLGEKYPQTMGIFQQFIGAVSGKGKLSAKEKELIAVALSLSEKCEWCIPYHTRLAIENGASDDEIVEAGFISLLMSGSPSLMNMVLLMDALKEFRK
ncbi:MAG: carboxymuconolactone decarboxylase family protein [Candidatus Thermoplasmatota archaeon]|nr:carboxymuconolactone decarboxylase family protein [Candidatus Thermoplasmatota archaeon]